MRALMDAVLFQTTIRLVAMIIAVTRADAFDGDAAASPFRQSRAPRRRWFRSRLLSGGRGTTPCASTFSGA
jgi:hypothetical protein